MLTRVGEFPPLFSFFSFYNGYLQGTSLGVSGPIMAGRVSGIAIPDTAHVSIDLIILFRAVNVCGFADSLFQALAVSETSVRFNEPLAVCGGCTVRVRSGGVGGCESGVGRSFHSCAGGHLKEDALKGGQYYSFALAQLASRR